MRQGVGRADQGDVVPQVVEPGEQQRDVRQGRLARGPQAVIIGVHEDEAADGREPLLAEVVLQAVGEGRQDGADGAEPGRPARGPGRFALVIITGGRALGDQIAGGVAGREVGERVGPVGPRDGAPVDRIPLAVEPAERDRDRIDARLADEVAQVVVVQVGEDRAGDRQRVGAQDRRGARVLELHARRSESGAGGPELDGEDIGQVVRAGDRQRRIDRRARLAVRVKLRIRRERDERARHRVGEAPEGRDVEVRPIGERGAGRAAQVRRDERTHIPGVRDGDLQRPDPGCRGRSDDRARLRQLADRDGARPVGRGLDARDGEVAERGDRRRVPQRPDGAVGVLGPVIDDRLGLAGLDFQDRELQGPGGQELSPLEVLEQGEEVASISRDFGLASRARS